MEDFFISYTGTNEKWAEWIAWTLEEADFTVVIQKWDFKAGSNFALNMHRATDCKRTIAVLSAEYLLESAYGASEWAAAFARDPKGSEQTLVPVRVTECEPKGLLKAIIYIDLVGKDEEEARHALLEGVAQRRAKPTSKPDFPDPSRRRQLFRDRVMMPLRAVLAATCRNSSALHQTSKGANSPKARSRPSGGSSIVAFVSYAAKIVM